MAVSVYQYSMFTLLKLSCKVHLFTEVKTISLALLVTQDIVTCVNTLQKK